jgi:hypothetical protein
MSDLTDQERAFLTLVGQIKPSETASAVSAPAPTPTPEPTKAEDK